MQFHPHPIRRGNAGRECRAEIDTPRSLIAPSHALPADRPDGLLGHGLAAEISKTYSFPVIPVGFHDYIYVDEVPRC